MLTMQIRFRPIFVALGSFLAASGAWAQNTAPAPTPAPQPQPAPVDAAEEPAELPPAAAEPVAPAPAAPAPAPAPNLTGMPAWPEPSADAATLQQIGRDRPAPPKPSGETAVFAEEWWSHARPVLELHGDLRVRWEMFYRFSLGRTDQPKDALWPRPVDSPYDVPNVGSQYTTNLCTQKEADRGNGGTSFPLTNCRNNTQAGANLRLRLNPEIHISDNLRISTQIDLLDNVVFGSRGDYAPSGSNPGDYEPYGFSAQNLTYSGSSGLGQVLRVKRAWAEYATPVGELRFGRMPNHWGLGMVNNSGDGYDDDVQSTIDRIQFIAGIKPLDLYVSGAWDFPNEGVSANSQSQAFDLAQLDDVDQYVLSVARRKSPELLRQALTRGEVVVNGGLQLTYRKQLLDSTPRAPGVDQDTHVGSEGYLTRRDAYLWMPDLWAQILYKDFRFELEAATIQGRIGSADSTPTLRSLRLSQWGVTSELSQRLLENRLQLGLGFGWASGDADSASLVPMQSRNGSPNSGEQIGDRTLSQFRFNPAYRVDLILHRNILQRVQGTYYFRPNLSYDFMRDASGQRVGGSIAGIWTRASEFMQTPGHARDLGIELDGAVYFQSKDGALNDNPTRMGGFYARAEYGILFPMSGLGSTSRDDVQMNVSHAMIVRLHLGARF